MAGAKAKVFSVGRKYFEEVMRVMREDSNDLMVREGKGSSRVVFGDYREGVP